MAVEVNELCCNLNKLLDDICKFLTDEGNYEKLSPYARKRADELIKRSKQQLKEIEKINTDNIECDGAYVDMDRNPENDEDGKNNIYSAVDETTVMVPAVTVEPQPNLYANLPAKNLSQDIKFGSLSWKCRIILKFEKVRRIYAGLHDNWLLIYSSEKDSKPLHTFYLKFYKADPIIPKQNKNPPQDFQLISTHDAKTYYFLALTHKDMLQWVSHINRCYDTLNNSSESDETYDIPQLLTPEKDGDDDEEIYIDLPDIFIPNKQEDDNRPPDLPARRFFNNSLPLPKTQKIENEHISPKMSPVIHDTTHRRVSVESINSEANSFSSGGDAEDETYGVFHNETSTKEKPQKFIPKRQENNSIPPDLPARPFFNNSLPLPEAPKIEKMSPSVHRKVSLESVNSEVNSFSSEGDAEDETYGVFFNETSTKKKPQPPEKPKILKKNPNI